MSRNTMKRLFTYEDWKYFHVIKSRTTESTLALCGRDIPAELAIDPQPTQFKCPKCDQMDIIKTKVTAERWNKLKTHLIRGPERTYCGRRYNHHLQAVKYIATVDCIKCRRKYVAKWI